jgi:poly-gamma-glutamate synthesis protein (capsule biosynthesis protein)
MNSRKKVASTLIVCLVALVLIAAAYMVADDYVDIGGVFVETTTEPTTTEPTTTEPPVPQKTTTVTIRSAGDVLIHIPVFQNARKSDGSYDFSHIFTYSEDIISDCDYFVANLETTLGGTNGRTYTGFPRFNSPDSIVTALKGAGVDCLLTANNHSYDTNGAGVIRTIEKIEESKLDYTGTRKTADGKKFLVKNINGIKFGIACYTYETPTSEGRKALNGLLVDSETAQLINSFKPGAPDAFYDEVKANIKAMKKKGTDVTVVYIHWGEEYQLKENIKQQEIAQKLCDLGVDVIIGGHPHVVQPMDLLTSTDGKHKTVCVYSMGNFLSNQRRSLMGLKTGHTEDGLIFEMTFSKYSDGTVMFESVDAIPTWVHLYSEGGKKVHSIVPLEGNLDKKAEKLGLTKTSDGLTQAKASKARTEALVAEGEKKCNDYLDKLKTPIEVYNEKNN